jgi:dihydroxy-acid dehydratase
VEGESRFFKADSSSHGFVIGHVVPEAQLGGPIALVQDGDVIHIDAISNTLAVEGSDEEMAERKTRWSAPPLKVSHGALYKYTKIVADASRGCSELTLSSVLTLVTDG